MNTSTKTRIPYLDFLKFFAIACVFLGHSVERTTGNDFWDNPIWSFIYTFHMPLFMLLCGYFFGSSLKISFWEMCRKKFIQLVVPSISAFLIMYAFTAVTRYNPCPELINISVIGFFNTVWFLKSVFFCYLIGYASIRLLRSLPLAITVSTLAVNLIPAGNIDYVNFMLPMFWTGYLCEKKREAIQTHAGKLLAACLIAFLAMLPFWSGRMTKHGLLSLRPMGLQENFPLENHAHIRPDGQIHSGSVLGADLPAGMRPDSCRNLCGYRRKFRDRSGDSRHRTHTLLSGGPTFPEKPILTPAPAGRKRQEMTI